MMLAERRTLNERRVYREIALPVSAFDVLQDLKRLWRAGTNAEVLTALLLDHGATLLKSAATDATHSQR